MGRSGFIRTIAVVGCIALALTLVPLFTVPATAAPLPWAKKADSGISPAPNVNLFTVPGVHFQGSIPIGSRSPYGIPPPAGAPSMNVYDGVNFTVIGADGLGDLNNEELYPTAVYGNELFIGTGNTTNGSQLYRWDGTGIPIQVPESMQSGGGWGEGVNCHRTVPVGVIDNRLVVCACDSTGVGFRLFSFDGTNWTEIAGPSAPTLRGLGNPNNSGVINYGEHDVLDGRLLLSTENTIDGLEVWTYDGTAFTRIGKAGDPGLWSANQVDGSVAVSNLEGKVYLGTGTPHGSGNGGGVWSWDSSFTTWT
ncbi:MAG: hypothetical protein KJ625_07455, partial [Actinobacteria bacterium]|nr:hypothetical protein [Actinomycetota bacterium]